MLTAQDHPFSSSPFGYRAEITATPHSSHPPPRSRSSPIQSGRQTRISEKYIEADITTSPSRRHGSTSPDSQVFVVQTVETRHEWGDEKGRNEKGREKEKEIGIGVAM